jgi:ketosteroid isomerase-like protein
MNNQTAVLDLIQRWATAELTGNVEAYQELLTPDFVGVGPVGFVLDADQWATRHNGDLTNHEFEVNDPHVRFFGDTAIVEAVQKQQDHRHGPRHQRLLPPGHHRRPTRRPVAVGPPPAQRTAHRPRPDAVLRPMSHQPSKEKPS